jgi:hypothetical protein
LKITDDLVLQELQRPTQGDCNPFFCKCRWKSCKFIQIGDDFPHDQAQFEIQKLIGDSHVQCVVIESNGTQIVGQVKKI